MGIKCGVRSRKSSLQADSEPRRRGAAYVDVGGSLAKLPDQNDALYIQRVRIIKGLSEPKPAKGAIPRAKQEILRQLDCPSRYYVHALKLAKGKFESLTILKKEEVPVHHAEA